MSAPVPGRRWVRASAPHELVLRDFDDGTVLFDCRDGQTHYVNPVASVVLKRLLETEMGADDLFAYVERQFAAPLHPEDRTQVLRILSQLEALKLIRCKQESAI
ncbi:MAG: HPr-rel-A system PqqD family peptide chaperone [Pseudomonadales bacterium]